MLTSIWENIVSNLIYSVVFSLAGGAVMVFLKSKYPRWAEVALYGSAGVVTVLFCLTLLQVRSALLDKPSFTASTAGTIVRTWVDEFGFQSRPITNSNDVFEYAITMNDGKIIQVGQRKDKDRLLSFEAFLSLPKDMYDEFATLSPEQKTDVVQAVKLDLSKAKVAYTLNFTGPIPLLNMPGLSFGSNAFISNEYDEQKFMQNLNEINFAVAVASIDVDRGIQLALSQRARLKKQ